jgi:hypothetical protein
MATAEYWRNWRKAHPEQARGYTRKYRESHLEQERERASKRRVANCDEVHESHRNWIKANPEKRKAQQALQKAVRADKIVRQPCEICGNSKSHGHHDDYSKPLVVRWRCALDHGQLHRL